jgi:diacylglycerol diphosphate phosphatase/phosphatidate phosphatase
LVTHLQTRSQVIKMRNSGYPSSVDINEHTDLKLGKLFLHHWKDWVFVVFLIIMEVVLNVIHPYKRYLGKEMFVTGEYMYPLMKQTVPAAAVPVT